MARIMITLRDDERNALQALAERERRHPADEAVMLLRWALELSGYLKSETSPRAVPVADAPHVAEVIRRGC